MMQNLLIEEGAILTVTNVSLPKANFVKFQAQHVDFLEISNPRAVLEHALRNFSCITKGDVICVPYNSKNYHFEIKEVKPQNAACIIETDCNVDFDAPVGYKEPSVNGSSAPSSGNASVSSSTGGLSNLKKQSAFAPAEHRTAACPAPKAGNGDGTGTSDGSSKSGGIRIVDGKIIRSTDDDGPVTSGIRPPAEMLASQTGATGIQRNAAICVESPTIKYWALNAGGGARLDGKAPTPLKDKSGAEVDLRAIRAEAASLRAVEQARATAALPTVGKTIKGEEVKIDNFAAAVSMTGDRPPVKKNKSRVGGKFSKLKSSATTVQCGSIEMYTINNCL
jgi:ubiquitin fusion degradation protein 1